MLGGVLYVRTYGNADILASSTAPALNTWTHVAATRSGTTLRIFVNGVQTGTTTNSTNFATGSGLVGNDGTNAAPWLGYISNMRVVKGTAVYTSNFTPSTTPLTAISGTSILTCQSNRFIDNSTNAFTITTSGSPTIQRFSPFSPTATYSTSTIGGSGYFDGTGDYLSVTEATGTAGAATVECWIYPITQVYSGDSFIVGNSGNALGAWALSFKSTNNTIGVWLDSYSGITITSNNTINYNTWNHIAIVKTGGVVYLYVNGIRQTSTYSQAGTFGRGTVVQVGQYTGGGQEFTGYISDVRTVYGTAVYSGATFTPPTAPLTAVANTKLLLNYTNAGIIDNTMLNNLVTVGNAQISTAQTKFGGGSMYFDGAGDWLVVSPNVTNNLGTGDFTIEAWVYLASGSTYQFLIGATANGGMQVGLNVPISGTPTIAVGTANGSWFLNFGASISISSNTWTHIAVTRSGTTNRAFINGVQLGSNITDSTSWSFTNNTLQIGATTSVVSLNGYIDDLRITKGVARYTSTFTPATSAFPTY